MKNILFLFMMYFISSNFAISQTACTPNVDPLVSICYNETCNGNWTTYINDVVTMEGCTVRVEMCIRRCANIPYTTQWTINSISFLGNCDSEWDKISLTPGSLTIHPEKWKTYKLNLIRTISLRDFQSWYNNPLTSQEMKNMVNCGTGYHAKVQYWEASCTKLCGALVASEGGGTHYVLTQIHCIDMNSCCGLESRYCVDSNGVVQIEELASGGVTNCFANPVPDYTGCPINAIDMEVTFCTDNCLD